MTKTMKRDIITYASRNAWLTLRIMDLTSSDTPSLFGCGYIGEEELFQNKLTATESKFQMDERMQWGFALQDAIAAEFARQNEWTIRKKEEYIRIVDLRLGSSFDFEMISKVEPYNGEILLEIKNVDQFQYKKEWVTDGFEIEATPYIEIQVQHQLLVSGLELAYIGALIGGNKGVLLRREANKKIQQAILDKAKKFWERIDNARNENNAIS